MISKVLENIEGIQIYYIVGLLVFFILFIIIFVRTMKKPNREMDEIKNSILVDNENEDVLMSNLNS